MLEEKIKSIFFYEFVLKANMIAQTNKNKQCSKGLKNCFIFCLVSVCAGNHQEMIVPFHQDVEQLSPNYGLILFCLLDFCGFYHLVKTL